MTDMERKTFCAALSRYGAQAQITMVFEEMAELQDGEVYTGYYNADATDKAVIAHNIQADITMDIIRTNAAIIKDMIEHCEEDE